MRTAMRCSALVLLLQIASAHVGIAGEVVQVKINDLAFSPAEITVKAGDTVEWVITTSSTTRPPQQAASGMS